MSDDAPTVQEDDKARAAEAADVATLRRQNDEMLTKLKYLQAEYENYRKRAGREAEAVVKFAHELLLSRLLPVLDELDAAVAALDGSSADGVRMVRDNLAKALGDAGLQEIHAEGAVFDPYVMDCVEQVPDPSKNDGVVKEVVRKGYRLHDRVLRPAQVVVVKNGGEPNG